MKTRIFKPLTMAFVLGLLATSGFTQTPEEVTVSFKEPAMRVSALLEELSKRTGQKLSATDDFRAEIVLVSVQNAPLNQLLDSIAFVTSGKWTDVPNGKRLVVDKATRLKEIERYEDDFYEELGRIIGLPPDRTQSTNSHPTLIRRDLRSEAGKKLISLFPKEVILEASRGERIVFSGKPNRFQRRLPQGAGEVIETYLKAVRELPKETETVPRFFVSDFSEVPDNAADYDQILVVLNGCEINRNSLSANLHFIDSQGRLLRKHELFWFTFNYAFRPTLFVYPQESPATIELTFSQRTQEWLTALQPTYCPNAHIRSYLGQRRRLTVDPIETIELPLASEFTPEAFRQVLDPETYEPHGYATTEIYQTLSDVWGKDLVVSIRDGFGSRTSSSIYHHYVLQEHFTITLNVSKYRLGAFEDFDLNQQIYTLKPRYAEVFRHVNVDRSDLAALISKHWRDMRIPLDAFIQYCSRNSRLIDESLIHFYYNRFFPTLSDQLTDYRFYRMLSRLSPSTRSKIIDQVSFSIGDLGDWERAVVLEFALSAEHISDPSYFSYFEQPSHLRDLEEGVPRERFEPTVYLANGLDPRGVTQYKTIRDFALAIVDEDGNIYPPLGALNSEMFSRTLVEDPVITRRLFTRVRLGELQTHVIGIPLFGNAALTYAYSEFRIPVDGRVYNISMLPHDLDALIKKMISEREAIIRELRKKYGYPEKDEPIRP